MPAIEHSLPIIGHLPDPIREMMRRRARELVGLGLIAASVAVITALATWSVQDPSLSHATSHPTRNLLGYPGAIIADLLMQIFGIGSVLVVLPIAIWGLRLSRIACSIARRFASDAGWWRSWPHPVSRAAGRRRRHGHCRRVSAGSSATRSCACRP
jgi:hypothetical protein